VRQRRGEPRDRSASERIDAVIRQDADGDGRRRGAAKKARGTKLIVNDSAFGTMLFDSRKQAMYVFERDGDGRTVCYGECAKAWPPVYTVGDPVAGAGVKPGLLGTLNRRDGTRQVTYAGRPLYFYAHEGPGQVLCHNVNLNGGYWWVLAPSGKRRA
jgi:predicted lipoprotein with Yx(FWY)xxD motif